ncbi:hypothetical protein [Sulfitobacter sp.]|uniref:hypothetical protein n=1 Tax=Sulfitobacter sp. TaxID=1903071 RepID=UPI003561C744
MYGIEAVDCKGTSKAKLGGRGVPADERVKRPIEFEEEVFRFLARNLETLELGDDVEIVRSGRDALVPSDFTVMQVGEAVAAIECKSHRNKKHRRYLLETLGMAALLSQASASVSSKAPR